MRPAGSILPRNAIQHVGAVSGQHEFEQGAGEARAGLDERDQAARGDVEAFQGALPVEHDLCASQFPRFLGEQRVVGLDQRRVALARSTQVPISVSLRRRCIIASSDRAGKLQRPEGGALGMDRGGVGRRRGGGTIDAAMRGATLSVDLDGEARIAQRVAIERALDGRQHDALGVFRALLPCSKTVSGLRELPHPFQ